MDAEIFHSAFEQEAAYRVGHAADADLETGPILDFGRDAPGYDTVNLGGIRVGQLRAWLIIPLDDEIDLRYMHAVLFAENVRHLAIDLHDHYPRAVDDGPLPDIGRAEIEVPAVVHRAGLEDDDIHGVKKTTVIIRHFPKIQRNVVAAAGVVFPAVVAGEMPAEHVEMLAFRIAFDHRAGAHRQARADLDIAQFAFSRSQRSIENIGLAMASSVIQPHAGLDKAGRVFRRDRIGTHG